MDCDVLVVGAGTSGLVLALTLLQNGLTVRIIEKELSYRPGQRGCSVQARTLEIYKFLGILPDIQALARPVQLMRQHSSPEGPTPLKTFQMTNMMKPTSATPYINLTMLGQDRHEQILRARLERDYGCRVELGTELVSFAPHLDQVVAQLRVKGKDKDGQDISETKFKWLIGADGAHSTVRKRLGLGFMGETRSFETLIVGDIHVKSGLDRSYWAIWGEPAHESIAMRPFEDEDGFNFFVTGRELDPVKVASSREELLKAFYRLTGKNDVEFGDLTWIGVWRPNIRMAYKFGQDNVFIVGDAAHVHSPTGGQGMNAGIHDSFNLAWKLALVHKGLAPPSLLDSYAQERIPVIASMLHMTTELLHKTFKNDGDSSEGWVRGYEMRQLGVNYRGSPLVIDDRYIDKDEAVDPYRSGNDGSVRGGDRAPDASGLALVSFKGRNVLSEGPSFERLFDIFKPVYHTVLIFSIPSTPSEGNLVDDILEVLSRDAKRVLKSVVIIPPGTVTALSSTTLADYLFIDADGHAFENYHIDGTVERCRVFIIRPDGYIGASVGTVEGVESYFKNIF